MDTSGGNPFSSHSPPPFSDIVDEYLMDGVLPLEKALQTLHHAYRLDATLEAVLYGVIGKYLLILRRLRIEPEYYGLKEPMEMAEAHGFALNEVMKDPRVDRLIEAYTVGGTEFFIMRHFGVDTNGD